MPINPYRIMWLFISFDLPTVTAEERKRAANFRKELLAAGFHMFQFSIYSRYCPSRECMETEIARVERLLPEEGFVAIMHFTDKQFEHIRYYNSQKPAEKPREYHQLELF